MRRLPPAALLLVGLAAFAACSSGTAPGWTYAPAPSATPVSSGAASGSPAASASASAAAPSGSPSANPSGSVAPSGSSTAASLKVTAPTGAGTTGFDPNTLETAANAPFTLLFDNQDATSPHNIVIKKPDGSKVPMGDTTFFTGPAQKTYNVPALPAGSYPFLCEVHPTVMTGTLTVK